ncbi:hypothetical protein [uncultured Secundilactobacillus sp.]|uniref:hypothetical protein n=1 Tax=uncultured Secundilactobacillus sp. TaxID=2813935 RepID=UPI00258FEF17|nr:hypothetical protein [uncultured Secundilactobacillus sp.]
MTQHRKWQLISILAYVAFIVLAIVFKFLDPAKIGLSWTIFWVVFGAGIAYYFYFKNVSYQEVIYYARALHLDQAALEALVPDRKKTAEVPNPDRPNMFSPLAQVPIGVLNTLTDELAKQAKAAGIAKFD